MKYWAIAMVVLKKFWPVAVEIAKMAVDGKITKEEVCVAVDTALGDDDVVYLWGKPNA